MPEVDGMVPNRWLSTLTINDYNSIDQVVNVINKLNEKTLKQELCGNHYICNQYFKG